jgi:very-short-patch-repair endonuclease
LVGRGQLLELGVSRRAIETRLIQGRLHRVHQGVYALGHSLLDVSARWMAAVMACGPDAALSHRSAGQLWGMIPRSGAAPEVTRPRFFRPRAGIQAHRSSLPADEIALVDGIPVTSPPRTLLDLAAVLSQARLDRAFNEMEVIGLTDKHSIPDLLERYPRRRGSAILRSLLGDRSALRGVTRSTLEECFVALIDDNGLPRPRLNADLAVRGRFFRVDCLWRGERLVVELDGRAAHGTSKAFEGDRERDRVLLAEGWRVTRVTWRQLHDEPREIVEDLRQLLRCNSRTSYP